MSIWEVDDTKTVADLKVGDHIVIIDETAKVIAIRPKYLKGLTYVMFEYVAIPKPNGYGNACSWLLFKPSEVVKRGY